MTRAKRVFVGASLIIVAMVIYLVGHLDGRAGRPIALANPAQAAEKSDLRTYYYPGTEELGRGEMRVIALGTGMPNARPSQAAACWLVQLGNGENFLFDLGTGSMEKFSTLGIPYGELTKIFLSHLHSDHFGDFGVLWMGGWVSGRKVGVDIWGPTGKTPETGTAYAIEHYKKAFTWDLTSRTGRLNDPGSKITVHEFDYTKPNQVVYKKDGVTIRSWPAIHAIDGPVSFSLEWNGLKFVFSGDSGPNKWMEQYGKNADIMIHETFFTVPQLEERFGWSRAAAINVGTKVHTSPEAAGKMFSLTKPRHAIAYHFFNDWDTGIAVEKLLRTTYDGPLTLAKDLIVWNVTKDDIKVRKVAYSEDSWPVKEPGGDPNKLPRGKVTPKSKWLADGLLTWPGIDDYEDSGITQ